MSSLQKFLEYVDDSNNQTNFKNRLGTAVGYQRFVVHLVVKYGLIALQIK